MKQLQAGYTLDSIKDHLSEKYGSEKVVGLLRQLSYFDYQVKSNISKDINNPDQIISVINNMISRGLPTRPSLQIEKIILSLADIARKNEQLDEIGTISYDLDISRDFSEKLYRALHIIEPRLKFNQIEKVKIKSWENLGSKFEEDFLYDKLPGSIGPFWFQLFESQRELENILKYSTEVNDGIEKYLNGSIDIFNHQRVDFSLEFPYKFKNKFGIIIEIDGSQHQEKLQKIVDEKRDIAAEKANWLKTLRIRTDEWPMISGKLKVIKELENLEYFQLISKNYKNPLYNDKTGLIALQITLIPFAIARIQKIILCLLVENKLSINDKKWNIAVYERDIPCAELALDDLASTFNSIAKLKGDEIIFPEINLYIDNTSEFINTNFTPKQNIYKDKKYDLFLDISILERSFLTPIDKNIESDLSVLIRSSHSPKTDRKFITTDLIRYKSLGKKNTKENKFIGNQRQVDHLTKFVQDIFRKKSFRPGQVEILNRALQIKSVIGLLPTGSGKSLTYQLAVLLQPGISIVVDPIKSLMKDQYDGLLKNSIDCALYINSSLSAKERESSISKINQAKTLFSFISPERLQDETFRKQMIETSNFNKHFFSYCVIDEAHCVSEWGHDFRTSYLRLGDNARNYCKTKSGKSIPFFALTATASYDVLADVQRELKIPDENSIVRLEKLDRPELQFIIKEITADLDSNTNINWDSKKAIGSTKQDELISILKNIPTYYHNFLHNDQAIEYAKMFDLDIVPKNFSKNEFYEKEGFDNNAGLVFCPHRNWLFGVTDNARKVSEKLNSFKIGTFMGSDNENERDEENIRSQTSFINNSLDLLVATKAFGMGIDKPNIRYVIHTNYPSSIESYYQEAGRAGRDRKIALGIILFNREEVNSQQLVQKVQEDGEFTEISQSISTTIDREILESFHRINFKGIAKEKVLLAELLTEIKGPTKRILNQLEDKIIGEFGTVVTLRTFINNNDRKILYLNPNYGSIYLDRPSLTYYPGNENITNISDYIKNYIQLNKPDNLEPFDWLNQYIENKKQEGIETILKSTDKPDKLLVVIPFSNNSIEQIAHLLKSNGYNVTERIVKDAQNFALTLEDFLNNLEKTYKKHFNNRRLGIDSNLHSPIKKLFTQIRSQNDTFKAIYRLSIIGVVDDYTVDYKSETITAYISRKPEGFYTNRLKDYLLLYNSPERVEERIQRLPLYKGNSEIQKCLGFLIKFIYEEIAEQRKEAIKAMEEACKIGLQDNGSYRFKEFIDLYMNSKYARPEYLPSDTEKGLKADFEIVKKYIALVSSDRGGQINNLKHLRGASTVLLVQRPDNFVFILLKAFSVFILERENEDFIEEAQNDFINGFLKMQEISKDDNLTLFKKSEYFKDQIAKFDSDILLVLESAESVLYHKLHTNWLTEFNKEFAGDYERTN